MTPCIPKKIADFITSMMNKHPLSRNIQIKFYLYNNELMRGKTSLLGTVRQVDVNGSVESHIYADQAEILVLKTIAHEYRHIMQWENADMEWLTLSSGKHDKEIDADLFGGQVAREYYYKDVFILLNCRK